MGKWCTEYGYLRYRYSDIFHDSDITSKEALSVLREKKKTFARYTYDHDCKEQTEWWYCLKDSPVSMDTLTAKQRYRVKKGLSNLDIIRLSPESDQELSNKIADLAIESFQDYPAQYRSDLSKELIASRCVARKGTGSYWGGVDKSTGELIGWAFVLEYEKVAYMMEVKVPTRYLNTEINAAMAYKICEYYLNEEDYKYVLDGERNMRHQTNYQKFLVSVLGFRYSYCRLNVIYKPSLDFIVRLLFPFRKLLQPFSQNRFIYKVICVLNQEEVVRKCKKEIEKNE